MWLDLISRGPSPDMKDLLVVSLKIALYILVTLFTSRKQRKKRSYLCDESVGLGIVDLRDPSWSNLAIIAEGHRRRISLALLLCQSSFQFRTRQYSLQHTSRPTAGRNDWYRRKSLAVFRLSNVRFARADSLSLSAFSGLGP